MLVGVFRYLIGQCDLIRRKERPNYEFFISILQKEFKKINHPLDWVFDWSNPDPNNPDSVLNKGQLFDNFAVGERKVLNNQMQGTKEYLSNNFVLNS